MWQRQAEGLANYLRRGRSAQKLATTAGTGTRPTAQVCGLLQGDFAVSKACANALDFASVLAYFIINYR